MIIKTRKKQISLTKYPTTFKGIRSGIFLQMNAPWGNTSHKVFKMFENNRKMVKSGSDKAAQYKRSLGEHLP